MTSALALRAADLLYDDASHTSKTPDGRDVPHVTHILSAVGVSVDFEALGAMKRDLADAIAFRRALGSAVHADCHAYDDNDLDWSSIAASPTLPFVEAWAAFRENQKLFPIHRERRVFHPLHWYTGTLDGIFYREDDCDRRILVDIKIGDPDDAGCRFQLAGYKGAHEVAHLDQPIAERWGVQLLPDKKRNPYAVLNYDDRVLYPDGWRDFQRFQAFVVTYNAQAARRRRAA